jgi:hypothetical protein
MPEISFGDNVRVRRTPETEALGVAGRIGQVFGQTTPSITGVAVVGGSDRDYALNVNFQDRRDTLWFAPQLLEFIDHAPGTEIHVGKVSAVRDSDGNWVNTSSKTPLHERHRNKAWWRFW